MLRARRFASRAKPSGARIKPLVPVYDPDALALFARFNSEPSALRKRLVSDLIVAGKDNQWWPRHDALHVPALGLDDPGYTTADDAHAARRNWIADQFNLTSVASPTFVADRGVSGNGSSSYCRTGLVPSAGGLHYTLNDAHVSVWSRTIGNQSTVCIGSRDAANVNSTFLQMRQSGGAQAYQVNQGSGGASPAVGDVAGHVLARRTSSTVRSAFKNGANIANQTVASTGLTGFEFYLGALNTADSPSLFSTRQYAAASIGGALSDTEALAFYNDLNTYLVAVGAA